MTYEEKILSDFDEKFSKIIVTHRGETAIQGKENSYSVVLDEDGNVSRNQLEAIKYFISSALKKQREDILKCLPGEIPAIYSDFEDGFNVCRNMFLETLRSHEFLTNLKTKGL